MVKKDCVCTRCNHKWQSRIDKTPEACPKCNNKKWNEPRENIIKPKERREDAFKLSNLDGP